ncbi:MAG: 16S rRNA (guanine(966)-N(2))-methyltransferase RsmD [Gallionellales bacterium GWA2_55_18]|nr:MAG: 16S rRNA (guanine(966)-N(2))-methyltransferase RsmD [Gallionellales bacterium GWA2_55_18]
MRKANKVRIIGGELRSRVIEFPDADGLRPTPDRVRETLFNWLGQTLYGRTCLDLFAGSGALGFEAASRGAEQVTMVEKNPAVFRVLQDNAKKLGCANVFIQCQDGLEFALHDVKRYDVIFLDPPFQGDYLPKLLEILPQRLNKNGVLYVESGVAIDATRPWQILKSGKAGQVHYQLLGISAND